jgi:hypothetical protein
MANLNSRDLATAKQQGMTTLPEDDMLCVRVPIRTVSEMNQREHWHATYRRHRVHYSAVVMSFAYPARLWLRAHPAPYGVSLIRIAPRPLDADNLAASFKAVQDEVARQLGVDDGSDLVRWTYAQRKGRPKEYAVEIRIEQARGPARAGA